MIQILCVRHGQAAAGWQENTDPGLSEAGVRQAERVARTLAQFDVKCILSSPLQRALETAAPFSQLLNLDVQVEPSFREIPTPGSVPVTERLQWLRSCADLDWVKMERELIQWRDQIIQRLQQIETSTVVFTHFMVLNAIMGYIENKPKVVNYQPEYCSVLNIGYADSRFVLLDLGAQAQSRIL